MVWAFFANQWDTSHNYSLYINIDHYNAFPTPKIFVELEDIEPALAQVSASKVSCCTVHVPCGVFFFHFLGSFFVRGCGKRIVILRLSFASRSSLLASCKYSQSEFQLRNGADCPPKVRWKSTRCFRKQNNISLILQLPTGPASLITTSHYNRIGPLLRLRFGTYSIPYNPRDF